MRMRFAQFLLSLFISGSLFAAEPAWHAYVINQGTSTVDVVDISTNMISAGPILVGSFPTGVALTPDAQFAYVTNTGGASLSVSIIQTSTNTVIATVPVGSGPYA